MELMLLKWKQSYVSDTYEISMWVRRIVRKNDFVLIYARPRMGSSCFIAMQRRPLRFPAGKENAFCSRAARACML